MQTHWKFCALSTVADMNPLFALGGVALLAGLFMSGGSSGGSYSVSSDWNDGVGRRMAGDVGEANEKANRAINAFNSALDRVKNVSAPSFNSYGAELNSIAGSI